MDHSIKLLKITCLCCEHPVSAVTPRAIQQAMQNHADYVNRTADRATDPHFEDQRLAALVKL